MRNNLMTIIKKELARFFGDKRMVFTTILMPGLMIYIMYSFMGSGLTSRFEADEDYTYRIYAENMPSTVSAMIKGSDINVEYLDRDGVSEEDMKQAVTDKDAEMLMVFPENFEADVLAYDSMTATTPAPQVALYYNSADTESTACYQIMASVLDGYEASMANKFDVNSGDEEYDLASKEDSTGQIFSMMLPMLLMIFLFSGCMAIAPESIAGEKERGTIATLLVTPMKRGQLAMGKIISLGIIGLLSGISSFVGTMLSLPKLMGTECNGCQRIQRHRLYPFIAGDSYHSIGTGWSISCNFSICKDSKGSRFYDYAADGCGNGNFRYIHAWKRSTEGILLVSDSFL